MGFPVSLSCGSIPERCRSPVPGDIRGISMDKGGNPSLSRDKSEQDLSTPGFGNSREDLLILEAPRGGIFSTPEFPGKRSGTTGEGKTASELQQGEGQDGHPEEFFPWKKRPGLGIAQGGLECPSLEVALRAAWSGRAFPGSGIP